MTCITILSFHDFNSFICNIITGTKISLVDFTNDGVIIHFRHTRKSFGHIYTFTNVFFVTGMLMVNINLELKLMD